MSKETRKVDLVGIIFEKLVSGFEPDFADIEEAKDLGINVDVIRAEVELLYPTELEDEQELDFN